MMDISIFCWNIANPSLERAIKQGKWLRKRSEDIFVLTEAKNSQGCLFLQHYFKKHNYYVLFPEMEKGEYGVMVLSKYPLSGYQLSLDFSSPRAVAATFSLLKKQIKIIGLYVPSRDASIKKIERKRMFLENLLPSLEESNEDDFRIVCGDFNILEPNHIPRYSFFKKWEYDFYQKLSSYHLSDAWRFLNSASQEYSWVGKTGDGYRYDHCFVSNSLLSSLNKSFYLHGPRKQRLSDHSALITKLTL